VHLARQWPPHKTAQTCTIPPNNLAFRRRPPSSALEQVSPTEERDQAPRRRASHAVDIL